MAKANSVVSLNKDLKGRMVSVTVKDVGTVTISVDSLTPEIEMQACLHGIGQKLVDAAALSADPKTGKPAPASEKFAAVREVADNILRGDWNAEREGGANSMLFEALTLMFPNQTPEQVREVLNGMSDAEKRALPFDAEVAPFYKQVRDARDAKAGKSSAGESAKAKLAAFKQA